MPRVIRVNKISAEETEARKDYFDRHQPHVICEKTAKAGEKFKVKVRMGANYTHPDDADHYIKYIQLWNLETLLAEVQFPPLSQGGEEGNVEVDFYLHPKHTLRLSAMSACTKHGLWASNEVIVELDHEQE